MKQTHPHARGRRRHGSARAILLAGVATIGCGAPQGDAPIRASTTATPSTSVAALAPTSLPETPLVDPPDSAVAPWTNIDALPEGARFRIGTRMMEADLDGLAISNAGVVAGFIAYVGVIETARDGRVRRVPFDERCMPDRLHYVGHTLLGTCHDRRLFRWDGAVVETKETACAWRPLPAFSADGKTFACVARADDRTLLAIDTASGRSREVARVSIPPRFVAVSNGGTVFASDTTLEAFAPDGSTWKVEGGHTHLAFDEAQDRVVGFRPSKEAFQVYAAKTGALLVHAKTKVFVGRPIQIGAGGHSWIVASGANVDGLFQVDTQGAIIRAWPSFFWTREAAVSPDGRFVAGSAERVRRVDLRTGTEVPAIAESSVAPFALTSSRSGDRAILTRHDGTVELVDMRAGKVLWRHTGPHDDKRGPSAVYSPDEKKIALADEDGHLEIIDAETHASLCKTEGAPATWLTWQKGVLVAGFRGRGDRGTITWVDESCRTLQSSQHERGLQFLREGEGEVFLAVAGDNLFSVDPKSPVLRLDLARRTVGKGARRVIDEYLAEDPRSPAPYDFVRRERARDGSTEITIRTTVSRDPARPWTIACRDLATKRTRNFPIPLTASDDVTLAGDGSWFTLPEGASILVVACRDDAPTPR